VIAEDVRFASRECMNRCIEEPHISFHEMNAPPGDSSDDYVVSYEASFKPKDFERAYLELFVTTDGYVGIGLETRERVARRLGIRNWRRRRAVAAGHEPGPLTTRQLQAFLAIVASARIVLVVQTGLFGLGSIKASIDPEDLAQLQPLTTHWDWLSASSAQPKPSKRTKVVSFLPW
jgi:hypothetical protein